MQSIEMKKVLLIAINARYSHPNPALCYLRNSISSLNTKTILREFTIQADPPDIARTVKDEAPDVLGISVYIWNTIIVEKLLALLEDLPFPCRIVLGGPEVSYCPEKWLEKFPALHHVVTGHGEAGFRRVVEDDTGKTEKIIRSRNPHFAQIPFPYSEDDLRSFRNRNIYYESSRGCPFRCAYCISSRSDQALEFRDVETVYRELALLTTQGPSLIKFIDRTFNADRTRGRLIWSHIIEHYADSGTCFHFEIHPALIEEDDIDLLQNCTPGLFQFEIGIQSTSDEALRAINRKGKWEEIKNIIIRIISLKTIHVHTDLIAGLPFEDMVSLERSFNEVYSLGADHFQFGFLKMLPGTEIRERAEEYGIVYDTTPPYEALETRWLSRKELATVKRISFLVERILNSGRFTMTLQHCIALHRSPFHWYRELAEHSIRTSLPSGSMRWEDLYELISGHIESSFPESAPFVRDCLAWDWCASSNTHRVPAILKSDDYRASRGAILGEFLRGVQKGAIGDVPEDAVKKARVFFPATEKFRSAFMEGKRCAVFIGTGRKPFLL
ncbi:MAG TPA: DUF4080 domain-containing protein [Spirochaetota bacterium]|nr:DUF4080 domain-containing protein [Spirochaetota bacterium]